jgi:hypothetical protein
MLLRLAEKIGCRPTFLPHDRITTMLRNSLVVVFLSLGALLAADALLVHQLEPSLTAWLQGLGTAEGDCACSRCADERISPFSVILDEAVELILAGLAFVLAAKIYAGHSRREMLACSLTTLAFAIRHSIQALRFVCFELTTTARLLRRGQPAEEATIFAQFKVLFVIAQTMLVLLLVALGTVLAADALLIHNLAPSLTHYLEETRAVETIADDCSCESCGRGRQPGRALDKGFEVVELILSALAFVFAAKVYAGQGPRELLACCLTTLAFAIRHSIQGLRFVCFELEATARVLRNGQPQVATPTTPINDRNNPRSS